MRSATLFRVISGVVLLIAGSAVHAHAGLISVSSASGPTPASIAPAVDAFRAFVGGGLVAGANGSFGGVRREINWDGVPDAFASPITLPPNFFNANSPRGAVFATPGAGFRVSADSSNPTNTPVRFGDLNPAYVNEFQTFSAERLFGVLGATVMDVLFFVPGTNTPAAVTAFGAVFVDNTGSSFPSCGSIQAFNGATSLGFFCAPASPAGGLSFRGLATTGGDVITRIRINLGTAPLGVTQSPTAEVVVMDDFIYSEPTEQRAVPEPATMGLLALGALGWLARRRRG
jgi:hypothetical protein